MPRWISALLLSGKVWFGSQGRTRKSRSMRMGFKFFFGLRQFLRTSHDRASCLLLPTSATGMDSWFFCISGGALIYFPVVTRAAETVSSSGSNMIRVLLSWATKYRSPSPHKAAITILTICLWFFVSPTLLGCIYHLGALATTEWFEDPNYFSLSQVVMNWLSGNVFLALWSYLSILGVCDTGFWNVLFGRNDHAAEAEGNGNEQRWQGRSGRISSFWKCLWLAFSRWEWDRVDSDVLLANCALPVFKGLLSIAFPPLSSLSFFLASFLQSPVNSWLRVHHWELTFWWPFPTSSGRCGGRSCLCSLRAVGSTHVMSGTWLGRFCSMIRNDSFIYNWTFSLSYLVYVWLVLLSVNLAGKTHLVCFTFSFRGKWTFSIRQNLLSGRLSFGDSQGFPTDNYPLYSNTCSILDSYNRSPSQATPILLPPSCSAISSDFSKWNMLYN